jgi:hypothetical protein
VNWYDVISTKCHAPFSQQQVTVDCQTFYQIKLFHCRLPKGCRVISDSKFWERK